MTITRFTSTPLSNAFDDLQRELLHLDRGWTCDRERASLRHAAGDIRHHVCAALAWLDDLPPETARYDLLDGDGYADLVTANPAGENVEIFLTGDPGCP